MESRSLTNTNNNNTADFQPSKLGIEMDVSTKHVNGGIPYYKNRGVH
jgi:hypothetical protein